MENKIFFKLGQKPYMSDSFFVAEITSAPERIFPIPGTTPVVIGMGIYKQQAVIIIDVRKLLLNRKTSSYENKEILLMNFQGNLLGLLVDEVFPSEKGLPNAEAVNFVHKLDLVELVKNEFKD